MIRFILRHSVRDEYSGAHFEHFYTVDCDVPDLEAALDRGGYGESGCDIHQLIGCELIKTKAESLGG